MYKYIRLDIFFAKTDKQDTVFIGKKVSTNVSLIKSSPLIDNGEYNFEIMNCLFEIPSNSLGTPVCLYTACIYSNSLCIRKLCFL